MNLIFPGNMASLDENIGKLMTVIEAAGMRDNTVVIFVSDNGGLGQEGPFNPPVNYNKIADPSLSYGRGNPNNWPQCRVFSQN